MTEHGFATAFGLLADVYQKPLSEQALGVYRQTLADVDDTILAAATRHIMATSEFFPTPALLLKTCRTLAAEQAGLASPEQAWEQILGLASRWYPQLTVEDQLDPAVYQALRSIGGIRRVALAGDDGDEAWRERSLARMYKEFADAYRPSYETRAQFAASSGADRAQPVDAPQPRALPRLPAAAEPDARVSNLRRIGERLPGLPQRALRETD